MAVQESSTRLSFHDATLAGVRQDGPMVRLSVTDLGDDQAVQHATVTIEGVQAVLRSGSPIEQLRMEGEDGEILALREESGTVLLAVLWHDGREFRDAVYHMVGGKIASVA